MLPNEDHSNGPHANGRPFETGKWKLDPPSSPLSPSYNKTISKSYNQGQR
jgi:hypothetical protein